MSKVSWCDRPPDKKMNITFFAFPNVAFELAAWSSARWFVPSPRRPNVPILIAERRDMGWAQLEVCFA